MLTTKVTKSTKFYNSFVLTNLIQSKQEAGRHLYYEINLQAICINSASSVTSC